MMVNICYKKKLKKKYNTGSNNKTNLGEVNPAITEYTWDNLLLK